MSVPSRSSACLITYNPRYIHTYIHSDPLPYNNEATRDVIVVSLLYRFSLNLHKNYNYSKSNNVSEYRNKQKKKLKLSLLTKLGHQRVLILE